MNEIYQARAILRYKGKYLLLKKIKDVHKDHVNGWEVPGGKIKLGEDPISATLRELKEETNLSCEILKELKLLKLEKDNIRTVTYVYLAEATNYKVILSDEHSDFIWVSHSDIDNLKKVADVIVDSNDLSNILPYLK